MNPDLKEAVDRHEKEIGEIKTAFTTKEDGSPDYEAHKKEHRQKAEDQEQRSKILSDVSTWAVIGIITLMFSHFVQNIKQYLGFLGK